MKLNLAVSTYWLWVTVAFGAACLLPWDGGAFAPAVRAIMYLNGEDGWQIRLIVDSIVATCLAVAATASLRILRGGKTVEPERWTIAGMFLAMTFLAIPLALLRLINADASVYVALVIMFSGYVLWRLVVAWAASLQRAAIRRRMRKYAAQVAEYRDP